MSHLGNMLTNAFNHIKEQSFFELYPWRIVFVRRTWDTFFVLYFYRQRIVCGNTSDKVIIVLSQDNRVVQKVLADLSVVLPKYKVKCFKEGVGL